MSEWPRLGGSHEETRSGSRHGPAVATKKRHGKGDPQSLGNRGLNTDV